MEEKYIVCIPKGCGFNDTMCQIYEAYEFSIKTNRTLIIDTRLSGLADCMTNYMEVLDPSNKIELGLSDKIIQNLNNLSCFPVEFTGKIDWIFHRFWASQPIYHYSTNQSEQPSKSVILNRIKSILNLLKYVLLNLKHFTIANKILFLFNYRNLRKFNANINLDDLRQNTANIIIHHMSGGGEDSIKAIKLFKLKSEISNLILVKLASLGNNYDAIHIRHTDYTTNYKSFLESIRQKLIRKKVLLCTDNYSVLKDARNILNETDVFCFNDYYNFNEEDHNYYPLHYQWKLPANKIFTNNIILFTDLIGLSRATLLYYTDINNNIHKTTVSGFSKLADNLKNQKNVLERWIGLPLN